MRNVITFNEAPDQWDLIKQLRLVALAKMLDGLLVSKNTLIAKMSRNKRQLVLLKRCLRLR